MSLTPEPILSVVVPVRNEERYIRPCLESILADAPAGGIEVIVVDGMSDDKTRQIVEEMARADQRIRLLENPSRFVPRAMNLGIAAASAPYIGRIDGHCLVLRGYFPGCLARLTDGGYECVGGVLAHEGTTPRERVVAAAMTSPVGVGSAKFRTTGPEAGDMLVDTLSFGIYRRDLFDKIGLFDEEFVRNQDDELNLRVNSAGLRILLVPSLRIRYFVRGSLRQLSRQYYQYGYWKWRVFAKHSRFASARHLAPSALVLSLIVAGLFALFTTTGRIAFALVLGPYLLAIALESLRLRVTAKTGFTGTALALMTLHFSYGTGLLNAVFHSAWKGLLGRAPTPPTGLTR